MNQKDNIVVVGTLTGIRFYYADGTLYNYLETWPRIGSVFNLSLSENGNFWSVGFDKGVVLANSIDMTVSDGFIPINDTSKVTPLTAMSPDGDRLIAGTPSGAIKICALNGYISKEIATGSPITAITWSPMGNYWATGHADNRLIVWSANDGKKLVELTTPSKINALDFSPDESSIAIGFNDGQARVYSINGKDYSALKTHEKSVKAIVYNTDHRLLTAGFDGKIYLYTAQLSLESTITAPLPFIDADFLAGGKAIVAVLGNDSAPVFVLDTTFNREAMRPSRIHSPLRSHQAIAASEDLEQQDSRGAWEICDQYRKKNGLESGELAAQLVYLADYNGKEDPAWTKLLAATDAPVFLLPAARHLFQKKSYKKCLDLCRHIIDVSTNSDATSSASDLLVACEEKLNIRQNKDVAPQLPENKERDQIYKVQVGEEEVSVAISFPSDKDYRDQYLAYTQGFERNKDWHQQAKYKTQAASHYNSLGWYEILLGNFENAEKALRRGLELDPNNGYLHTNLPLALLLQGKTKAAKKLYKKWRKQPFDPRTNYQTYREVFLDDLKTVREKGVIPKEQEKAVMKMEDWLK